MTEARVAHPESTGAGPFAWRILARCPRTRARSGQLTTPHGPAATPAFMPVGTSAAVKGVDPEALLRTGSEVVLCNTYHLALRPGDGLVRDLGGLHRFMGWPGPILTDSGGFQVYSLASLSAVDRDGVTFRSHLDGRLLRLTPERAMEIQLNLGADVIMVFDECLPHDATAEAARRSVEERTTPWAAKCLELHPRDGRALFAIGQGGLHAEVREAHLRVLSGMAFDGFAIGGLSVGETATEFRAMVDLSTRLLPADKPRYLMGVGSLPEILEAVALGVDLFDCVLPTRNARNGQALTATGPMQLRNARFARDSGPIEDACPCATCARGFSRAYLRHLLMAKEMLGATLMTLHNLTFMQRLMAGIRAAIAAGNYAEHHAATLATWRLRGDGVEESQ